MKTDSTKTLRVYKYRIYPTNSQIKSLDHLFYKARQIYNLGIQIQRFAHECEHPYISMYDLSKLLNDHDKENDFYHSGLQWNTIGALAERIDNSYQKYFDNIKRWKRGELTNWKLNHATGEMENFPPRPPKKKTYKGKNYFPSIPYRKSGYKLIIIDPVKKKAKLKLSGVGEINLVYHRDIPDEGVIKRCIVMRRPNGKFYVAFQCEIPTPKPLEKTSRIVGIDIGIHYLLAFSDGTKPIDNEKWYVNAQKKLKRLQRKASRQRRINNPNNFEPDFVKDGKLKKGKVKKGVRNWNISTRLKETERQIANLHEHIAQQRWYFWHTKTEELTRKYDLIALEDLDTAFMRKNRKLAKFAHDAGHATFRQMLETKAKARGVHLEFVDPKYTSQTCPECGFVHKENRKTQANFTCLECGHHENADIVGAKNILKRALDAIELRQNASLKMIDEVSVLE
jgi:putative transposase